MSNRLIRGVLCCVLTTSGFSEDVNQPPNSPSNKENLEWLKLKGAAAAYVDAFNRRDTALLTELFAADAAIHLTSQIKIVGHEEIKEYFRDIFEQSPDVKIGLEATAVHFKSPTRVVEKGSVVMDSKGKTSTHYYVAEIRKQEDGKWRIQNSKGVMAGENVASDSLAEVSGIIGDWVATIVDARYKVTYMWDPSGAWIIGKGRYVSPDTEPIHTTTRIGRDSKTGSIVSWSFDSMGGYSQSHWMKVGDEWQLQANGVNAEGQSSRSKQIITLVDSHSVNWRFTERELEGENLEGFSMRLVKSPPKPFTSMEGVGE